MTSLIWQVSTAHMYLNLFFMFVEYKSIYLFQESMHIISINLNPGYHAKSSTKDTRTVSGKSQHWGVEEFQSNFVIIAVNRDLSNYIHS